MTDDLRALTGALRSQTGEWQEPEWAVARRKQAADAIDALAERADALHKALRDHVLHGPFDANRDSDAPFVSNGCLHCSASWSPSETENHAESCLAAPSAPSTESAD